MKIPVSLEWLYTSPQMVSLYQPTGLKVVWAAACHNSIPDLLHIFLVAEIVSNVNISDLNENTMPHDI